MGARRPLNFQVGREESRPDPPPEADGGARRRVPRRHRAGVGRRFGRPTTRLPAAQEGKKETGREDAIPRGAVLSKHHPLAHHTCCTIVCCCRRACVVPMWFPVWWPTRRDAGRTEGSPVVAGPPQPTNDTILDWGCWCCVLVMVRAQTSEARDSLSPWAQTRRLTGYNRGTVPADREQLPVGVAVGGW